MRWAVALLLLAGCSGPSPPTGPEAPLADVEGRSGGSFDLVQSDLMAAGVDETWSFEVHPGAQAVSIVLSLMPVQGHRATTDLRAQAIHNGTVAADGSLGPGGSVGALPKALIDIFARDPANATALEGRWQVVLSGGPQVAEYDLRVRIRY